MSGVKSNQMTSLLDSLYGEENYSHMNFGSTNKLIDKGDFNLCSVMCDNDFSVVIKAAIKQVVKVAEEGPVIVFGMEDHIGEIKGQTTVDTFTVNDIDTLRRLKDYSMKLEKCIVFLSDEFACGVDIKFDTPNATVLVLRDQPDPRHLIR
jgi:hypothetical protein